MSPPSAEALQQYLRRLCAGAVPPQDDALLKRFVEASDRGAFELLIARHGPMVLGAARRLVDTSHDAEDVFQAVFLSFARLAKTIRQGQTLPAWLHKATCRIAARVRANHSARPLPSPSDPPLQRREQGDPAAGLVWQEVRQALDEELQRLPERLRSPLLLCYLSGLTRDEAARQLGWSLGTLKRRLDEGRRALRGRLERRGIGAVGLALTVLAPEVLQAAVSKSLLESSVNLVFSAGAVVPTTISALALRPAGAMKGIAMKPILALLAAAAIGVGIYAATGPANTPDMAEAKKQGAPAGEDVVQVDDPLPAGSTLRFGTSRFRQGVSIVALAVSADGKTAVVGTGTRFNGSTRAFDLLSGRPLFTLENDEAEAVAYSADGRMIVTKQALRLHVRDARTGQVLRSIDLPQANPRSEGQVLVSTPDGKAVATVSAGKDIHLIDIESGKTIRDFAIDNPESNFGSGFRAVLGIAFSPDGKRMASGGFDNDQGNYFARLWDVETGKELRRFMHGTRSYGIPSLAFSPDATTLATRSHDGRLRLFEVGTGKERKIFPQDGGGRQPGTAAFSPDGKTVAAAGDSIRLYDAATGEERLRIDRKQASGLHFTHEGKTLTAAVDGAIYRWDTATGDTLTPEAGDSVVEQILVNADGSRVVTRGQAGDGHIWDGASGKHLRRIQVGWQRGLTLSPDGRFLAWPVTDEGVSFTNPQTPGTTYSGSRIRLYDVATDKVEDRFPAFKGDAPDLAFTSDGEKLVTVDQHAGTVRVWDFKTAKEVRSFPLVSDALKKQSFIVGRARLSPDGKTVAATYQEHSRVERLGRREPAHLIRLWDVATAKEHPDLNGGHPIDGAFSPDGRFVVTNGGNSVRVFSPAGKLIGPTGGNHVYEMATGRRAAALPDAPFIHAAAFSRDGRFLATAVDGAIHLWETATWTKRNEIKGHPDRVTALAFSPRGHLLSGSVDTTVLAWDSRGPRVADPIPLERAWNDLATRESGESLKSERRFLAAPAESVKFFAERIKPPTALDPDRTRRWLADLGSDAFAVREAASEALRGLDEQARPYLEAALDGAESTEVRARVTKILEQRGRAALTAEQLRQLRAVMILEMIGDGESKDLLKRWSGGPGGARLTVEASAALERLEAGAKAKR